MLRRGGTGGIARCSRAKMVRQNPVSNPQETSQAGDPELARWLTRDLRPKGAPLSSPPSAGSAPPPSEAEVLAGWLAQDLTPKNSLRPRGSAPPSERPAPARPAAVPPAAPFLAAALPAAALPAAALPGAALPAVPSFPASPFRDVRDSELPAPVASPPPPTAARVEVAAPPPAAPAAVDSLAPQTVTPDPPSLPVVAPASLDDDDLAVLPGRRRGEGSDRRKYAFVLLGVLCFAAAIGVGITQRGSGDAGAAASMGAPTDVGGALPPPPPSADDLLAAPEPAPEPQPARRAKTGSEEPDDALDPLDPRNAVGGPSVRRYADVPSPTLSRLAREQRRLQRERDEAKRKAKAKDIPR
jgi:hypothetical protein